MHLFTMNVSFKKLAIRGNKTTEKMESEKNWVFDNRYWQYIWLTDDVASLLFVGYAKFLIRLLCSLHSKNTGRYLKFSILHNACVLVKAIKISADFSFTRPTTSAPSVKWKHSSIQFQAFSDGQNLREAIWILKLCNEKSLAAY